MKHVDTVNCTTVCRVGNEHVRISLALMATYIAAGCEFSFLQAFVALEVLVRSFVVDQFTASIPQSSHMLLIVWSQLERN